MSSPALHHPTSEASTFRPDIAGLRAFAIASVVLFHYAVPGFSGGFLGVDVFFVISGFLMTQIVLGRIERRRFSFKEFVVARVRRIFPAMLGLLSLLLTIGFVFLEPTEYSRIAKLSAASLFGLTNFVLASESGYFAPERDANLLLHLWSLSVEFQFYCVYPFLLLWLAKRDAKKRDQLLLLLSTLSFASWLLLSELHASAAFYLLPGRLWEFFAGALAFSLSSRSSPFRIRFTAFAGALVLLGSLIVFHFGAPFPGIAALLPVLGAALVLYAGGGVWILENKVCGWLGLLSYSLYLWHWPIWVAAKHFGFEESPTNVLALLVLAIILSILSYRCVERPFLERGTQTRISRHGIRFCGAGAFTVLLLSAIIMSTGGLPARVPPEIASSESESPKYKEVRCTRCFLLPPDGGEKLADLCFNPSSPAESPNTRSVMFFGDSHAAYLWPGISRSSAMKHLRLLQATAAGCPPLFFETFSPPDPKEREYFVNGVVKTCDSIQERILKEIETHPPSMIVLHAHWFRYSERGVDVPSELERSLNRLLALRTEIVIIGPISEWLPTLPQKAQQDSFLHARTNVPERLHDTTEPKIEKLDRELEEVAKKFGVQYISLRRELCNEDGCLATVPGEKGRALIAYDESHNTVAGSRWIVEHVIVPELFRRSKSVLPTR